MDRSGFQIVACRNMRFTRVIAGRNVGGIEEGGCGLDPQFHHMTWTVLEARCLNTAESLAAS